VSVGRPDQLRKFLDINPELKNALAYVDDSDDFQAYRQAGFRTLLGEEVLTEPPKMKAPTSLGPGKAFSYLKNVAGLAPMPKSGAKFGEIPKGVRVLGGTYAVDGGDIVFSHQDAVPGATPDIAEVLKSVGA
jgi:hypothetical protein